MQPETNRQFGTEPNIPQTDTRDNVLRHTRPTQRSRRRGSIVRTAAFTAALALSDAAYTPDSNNTSPMPTGPKPTLEQETTTSQPRQFIIESNQVKNPDTNQPLSLKLDDLGMNGLYAKNAQGGIEFTEKASIIKLDNRIDSKNEAVVYFKLAKGDKGVSVFDLSPNGVSPHIIDWVGDNSSDLLPLLQSAFNSGALNEVVFASSKSPNRYEDFYFDTNQKRVVFAINPDETVLSSERLKMILAHEAGHAVLSTRPISSLSKDVLADKNTYDSISQACSNIREIALRQLEVKYGELIGLLDRVSTSDPKYKPGFQVIIDAMRNGTISNLYPKNPGDPSATTETPSCEFRYITQAFGGLIKQLGLQTEGTSLNFTLEGLSAQAQASDVFHNFMSDISIYSTFTERNYTGDKNAGHPYLDLEEAAAGFLTLTVNAPERFGTTINSLPPEQKAAVLQLYMPIMHEFGAADPNFASSFLNGKINSFKKAAGVS